MRACVHVLVPTMMCQNRAARLAHAPPACAGSDLGRVCRVPCELTGERAFACGCVDALRLGWLRSGLG